jgi:hypothetical protein
MLRAAVRWLGTRRLVWRLLLLSFVAAIRPLLWWLRFRRWRRDRLMRRVMRKRGIVL